MTMTHKLRVPIGFLLLAVALIVVVIGCNASDPNPDFPTAIEVQEGGSAIATSNKGDVQTGDIAPDFTLKDIDDNIVSLADFRGQPVIVNFWATWCAPCRIEMPEFEEAFHAHADDNLVILALNQDEEVDAVRDFFVDELNLSFTALLDQNNLVNGDYTALGALPTTYFINEEGIVTVIHRGPIASSQLDVYLEQTITN